jgi:hypothetical protein
MLFRAVFWTGIVALLMPHEGGAGHLGGASSPNGAPTAETTLAETFQDALLARLSDLRSEIEAAERVRAARGG